jgi:hypothetical protein
MHVGLRADVATHKNNLRGIIRANWRIKSSCAH